VDNVEEVIGMEDGIHDKAPKVVIKESVLLSRVEI
jgi:hypothetical protein